MRETTMRAHMLVAATCLSWLTLIGAAQAASTQADFDSALAAAQATEKEAGALKNQWTTTEDVLSAAKKAAATGDFDKAVADAKRAEALARASIAQATEQAEAWRAGVIR
jgi:hypothetical protein